EGPRMRVAEGVSGEDFIRDEEGEQEDEPAEQLAYPGIEAVDTEQDALHGCSTLRNDEGRGYTEGRRQALRECRSVGCRGSGKAGAIGRAAAGRKPPTGFPVGGLGKRTCLRPEAQLCCCLRPK